MKIAIPCWQDRISPVFDVARDLQIVDTEDAGERGRPLSLTSADPHARAQALRGAGVEVLICGAVSRPHYQALLDAGIDVKAHNCGRVDCVVAAFLQDPSGLDDFRMPGFCGRGKGRRGLGRGLGRGQGGGRGRGQGQGRTSRAGDCSSQ